MANAAKRILESIKEDIKDSLSPANILKDLGAEIGQQARHGAHEVAAALFSNGNNAFVMYPRQEQAKDDQQHGVHGQAAQQPEPAKQQEPEMER